MPTLGILFYRSPVQTQAPETAVKLAEAAVNKGVKVKVFCFMDGVYAVEKGHKRIPKNMTNVEEAFKKLSSKNVDIVICTLTADQRAVKEVIEGVEKGGTPDLADIVNEADRFIVIT